MAELVADTARATHDHSLALSRAQDELSTLRSDLASAQARVAAGDASQDDGPRAVSDAVLETRAKRDQLARDLLATKDAFAEWRRSHGSELMALRGVNADIGSAVEELAVLTARAAGDAGVASDVGGESGGQSDGGTAVGDGLSSAAAADGSDDNAGVGTVGRTTQAVGVIKQQVLALRSKVSVRVRVRRCHGGRCCSKQAMRWQPSTVTTCCAPTVPSPARERRLCIVS